MKEKLFAGITFIMIVVMLLMASYSEQNYNLTTTVYEVNGNAITVEDSQGDLWEFISDEKFSVGETIKLHMDNRRTETDYTDDVIVDWKRV